jgi:hypothetical protein
MQRAFRDRHAVTLADPAADGDYSESIDVNRAQYPSRRPIAQDDPALSIALLDVNFDAD